ncbi:MAG: hypothetical protein PVI24_15400, partial [Myxococcales bacterium]
ERQKRWSPSGETSFVRFAPSNVLIFELEGGHRAMVRPSGTEPKLKYYFYALSRPSDRVDLTASEQAARSIVQSMVEDLVPPAAR